MVATTASVTNFTMVASHDTLVDVFTKVSQRDNPVAIAVITQKMIKISSDANNLYTVY